VGLGARAFGQTSYWKNSETLWNHAIAVTGENDVAHNNLGFLFLRGGELDKAISEFQTALNIRSRNTQSHYSLGAALIESNLGNALAREQLWDAAIEHLQEAVRLRRDKSTRLRSSQECGRRPSQTRKSEGSNVGI
jgi:tetratricopeptide (TPR) repeat protein